MAEKACSMILVLNLLGVQLLQMVPVGHVQFYSVEAMLSIFMPAVWTEDSTSST